MPSEQHNLLVEKGLRWLQNRATGRGLRGGFEVPVADGYVADAVGLCAFQHRFAEMYVREGIKQSGMSSLLVPEVACVFEAKATRADFLATFGGGERHKNRKQPVGSLHWVVCTRKIAEPGELPPFWGMLSTRGNGLTEVRRPTFCELADGELERIAYQVLWYAKNSHEPFAGAVYDEWEH